MKMSRTMSRRNRPQLESLEGRALLTAGMLDTTFGGTGMVTTVVGNANAYSLVSTVAVQSNLDVVVAGSTPGTASHFAVARYNPDGSLDTTFGTGGESVITIS